MPSFRLLSLHTAILFITAFAVSQPQAAPPRPQTARQALIEMITTGGDSIQKHLTVEVQDLLKSAGKAKAASLAMFGSLAGQKGLQGFDSGEVLFAYEDPAQPAKLEVRVDNDDLAGDEDSLLLTLHAFRDGKEQEGEELGLMSSHFTVSMKLEQGIWRLSKISIGAEFPVGDPKFIQKTFLKTATGAATGLGAVALSADSAVALSAGDTEVHVHDGVEPAAPLMQPEQVIRMLAFAEASFAREHSETGFTCSLSDLAQLSKMMGVDQQVVTGTYNGYRFALAGCEGKPSGSYQIIAEPIMAKAGKAFCTDATQNLRISDDGRGATCLISGRVQVDQPEDGGGMVGFTFSSGEPPKK